LLGIRETDQITRDPLVGQIFENLVVIEVLKDRYNKGQMADLYYYRDSNGNEVDLLAQSGRTLEALEIKSASTFKMEQLKGIRRFKELTDDVSSSYLVYTGKPHKLSDETQAIDYKAVASR
jgi:predicted AAA+ superfamily ATPase